MIRRRYGMNLANCPRCGKLHVMNLRGICGNCIKEIEFQYEDCIKYLREHKGTTITELSEAVEVPVKQITQFIREGRISIANAPNMSYACEVCGNPIRDSNMCDSCRARLNKDIQHAYEDDQSAKKEETQKTQGTYRAVDKFRNM